MQYNCAIVDDEPLAIELIENYLNKFEQFKIVGTFTDSVKAFIALKDTSVELLFLDIEMPDFSGLEFIKAMKVRPEIIITTAYREYAVEGFDLDILDYLVKPIPFDRFVRSIDKFLDGRSKQGFITKSEMEFIMVRADRKDVKITVEDILYIEGLKDYVKIVLDQKTILTKESIGNFYNQLNHEKFIRSHKSYIIALSKITAVTSYDVEIGEIEIPIGRVYKDVLMDKLKKK